MIKNIINWISRLFSSSKRKKYNEQKEWAQAWSNMVEETANEYLFSKGIRNPTPTQKLDAYRAIFKAWFVKDSK